VTVTGQTEGGLRGVVAVGGSAGGVEALSAVAAGLPDDLPFAVLMALHMPTHAPSVLADIIDRRTSWQTVAARDGLRLEPGRIYVAVPGHHLLTRDHRVMLSDGPTESGHRPALNALFRSVATAFGPRAIGVLVSGVLDDGVLGLAAIRSQGGTTVCQEPEDALFPAMPRNALRAGVVDHTAAAADLGALLSRLADRESPTLRPHPDRYLDIENRIAMSDGFQSAGDDDEFGEPTGFVCPDCGGSLQYAGNDHYRCHVGHAWTADALLTARDSEVERALWVAVRALAEKSRLARQLADKAVTAVISERYGRIAAETDKALAVLRSRLGSAGNGSHLQDD
jgi:two-component system, chemotaxis family, protein-glutamate methylesterase/glutaminase